MSKDYCSGLFGCSPWQPPARNYRGLLSDHDLRSITPDVYPAGSGRFRSSLCPDLWAIHDFALESYQVQNAQFPPMQGQCYNPSVPPRAAVHHDCLKATSYDYPLQLKKLDLGTQIFERPSLDPKFIVFDQSGSQRNVFISSINSLSPPSLDHANQTSPNGPLLPLVTFNQDVPAIANYTPDQSSWGESKLLVPNDESEMHENTEDLEALLCSNDNDYDDIDNELASTGHSPSDVIVRLRKETEGYFSASSSPQKRRKITHAVEDVEIDEMLADTASSSCSSPKTTDSSHVEDIQLFCSGGSHGQSNSESGSNGEGREVEISSVAKKLRREKIRETVGILRDLLPGGMQKDATAVLDEAIHYLQSLKLKVRSTDPVLGRQI